MRGAEESRMNGIREIRIDGCTAENYRLKVQNGDLSNGGLLKKHNT